MSKFEIQISDLPGEFREVAAVIGMDAAMRLAKIYGGEAIYIPQMSTLSREARNRRIRAEFDGANFRELAQVYGLTLSAIREIVRPMRGRERAGSGADVVVKQLSLF